MKKIIPLAIVVTFVFLSVSLAEPYNGTAVPPDNILLKNYQKIDNISTIVNILGRYKKDNGYRYDVFLVYNQSGVDKILDYEIYRLDTGVWIEKIGSKVLLITK
ncbi:MAG: hypothetical protein WCQ99_00745 [Pseudomonadota bacterium]